MTSLRQRLAALVESLRQQPRVVTAQAVLEAYGDAGGGLLAGGLAYSGLLASLSACLLIVGLIGFLVRDPVRQAALVEELALRLPPLAELLRTGLDRVADSATQFSILGLLGLSWGISRFYGDIDTAFGRVFSGVHQRGLRARLVRGLVVTGILIGAIVGSVALGTVTAMVDTILPPDALPVVSAATSVGLILTPVLLVRRERRGHPPLGAPGHRSVALRRATDRRRGAGPHAPVEHLRGHPGTAARGAGAVQRVRHRARDDDLALPGVPAAADRGRLGAGPADGRSRRLTRGTTGDEGPRPQARATPRS